jgi:hypothetical protein
MHALSGRDILAIAGPTSAAILPGMSEQLLVRGGLNSLRMQCRFHERPEERVFHMQTGNLQDHVGPGAMHPVQPGGGWTGSYQHDMRAVLAGDLRVCIRAVHVYLLCGGVLPVSSGIFCLPHVRGRVRLASKQCQNIL